MNPVLFLGLAAAMAAAPGDVAPGGVMVSVTLEPPVTPYHRQVRFSIAVEAPASVEVTFPDMVDGFGELAIYGLPEYEAVPLKGERVRITETYTLDPIFPGDYAIDPVTVRWGDGQERAVASPSLRVRDLTEEERAEAMRFDSDLAEPVFTKPSLLRRWWFWTVLGLVTVVAVAGTLYWRRGRVTAVPGAPDKPAWEIAYGRLRALDQRQLAKVGKFGLFYVDLSSIVRYYIEDRFHIHAPEQTTPEFLAEVTGGGVLSDAHQRLLAAFLRHCDRVKFAQHRPTVAEMETSFSEVLRFVDETVPPPEDEVEEAAA